MNIYFILLVITSAFHIQFQIAIGLEFSNPQQCFDVLDGLPANEIEKIYFMSFQNVIHTHPAADILQCFLRASHHGDKSVTKQYLDVYEKCEDYEKENFQHFGNQQLRELVSLGLPYDLENYLRSALKTGSKDELEQAILHVQDVMSKSIELSQYYKDYKKFIGNKIKPKAESSDFD